LLTGSTKWKTGRRKLTSRRRAISGHKCSHLWLAALLAFLLLVSTASFAYSVLTHEQVVDFLWDSHIKKILLERYPNSTEDDLRQAHAYAYGGCLIQDMGYYPHGNKFFSDLVHYVRSGDFVTELIRDSQNLNELAFALGALSHYVSDTTGHPTVNAAVALEFPKLRAKYGDHVTYAQDPKAHIRTEFGFDVLQVAKQRYSSQAYHDFIGFEVAQPLLERAFLKVYGMELKQIFPDEEQIIGSYRRAISTWIPRLTQVALITKKTELKALPNFSPKRFRYLLSRTDYEKTWGKKYDHPGFGAKFLAVVVRLLPKVGPLRTLDIKPPTPRTEAMYIKSVEDTVNNYRALLAKAGNNDFKLADNDLDTGSPTQPGEYSLTDKTYSKLVQKLAENHFAQVSPALRADVLNFYADLSRPVDTKKHKDEWNKTLQALEALKSTTAGTQQPAAGDLQ
jgi:hypothetical protein